MTVPAGERKQIENEMLFRRKNEKVGQSLDQLDALLIADGNPELADSEDLVLGFKCECSDENCDERITMKLSLYRKLHLNRSTFIVRPNHDVQAIEKVIENNEDYSVVKKNKVADDPEPGADLNQTSLDNATA